MPVQLFALDVDQDQGAFDHMDGHPQPRNTHAPTWLVVNSARVFQRSETRVPNHSYPCDPGRCLELKIRIYFLLWFQYVFFSRHDWHLFLCVFLTWIQNASVFNMIFLNYFFECMFNMISLHFPSSHATSDTDLREASSSLTTSKLLEPVDSCDCLAVWPRRSQWMVFCTTPR